MKKMFTAFWAGVFFFGLSSYASAVIITFDDLETDGFGYSSLTSYSDQGLNITSNGDNFIIPQKGATNYYESAALVNLHVDGVTTLSLASGDLYTLNSIDLHLWNNISPANVHFYGYDQSDALVGDISVVLTTTDWLSVAFDENFANISYVQFAQTPQYHQFDNIVFDAASNPVPEPSTFILMVFGLAGLAFYRRKQKNS